MNKLPKIGTVPVRSMYVRSTSWDTALLEGDGQLTFRASRQSRGNLQRFYQHTVRNEFMRIHSPEEALAFFRKYGPFERDWFVRSFDIHGNRNAQDFGHDAEALLDCDSHFEEARPFAFEQVGFYQSLFRKFMMDDPLQWSNQPTVNILEEPDHYGSLIKMYPRPRFTVELAIQRINSRHVPTPYLRQDAPDVRSAIFNSIYIDKMACERVGICEGCGISFSFSGGRVKRFHSDTCADAARQARSRKHKRAGLAKITQSKPSPKAIR